MEDTYHREVVAGTAEIVGSTIRSVRFLVVAEWVWLGEEGEGEDACQQVGEGSGMGENVVNRGPFSLILIGARFKIDSPVSKAAALSEQLELRRISFGIEVAHDDEVGALARCTYRIGV